MFAFICPVPTIPSPHFQMPSEDGVSSVLQNSRRTGEAPAEDMHEGMHPEGDSGGQRRAQGERPEFPTELQGHT